MSNDKITLAKISDCTISRGNRLLIKNISLSISVMASFSDIFTTIAYNGISYILAFCSILYFFYTK